MAKSSSSSEIRVQGSYGRLALSFEENRGQTDKSVTFLSRGAGYGIFLTGDEAVLTLTQAGKCSAGSDPAAPRRAAAALRKRVCPEAKGDTIRMHLEGAKQGTAVSGGDPLPGKANYFAGNDPAKWQTDVPTYARVRYTGVYPGVDLVYYGNQRQLEYDFVVAPGADPKPIRLSFAGATKVAVAANGDLAITASHGAIAFHKPLVYQETPAGRKTVDGTFAMMADGSVGFHLGKYDRTRALVIDPTLAYSTYLGGSGASRILAIAVDSSGSAYVAGSGYVGGGYGGAFPTTTGSCDLEGFGGTTYAFISKLNPAGTALVYSSYLVCAGSGAGYGISSLAVDSSGSAYLTGTYFDSGYPTTAGAYQTSTTADATAFVTKFNPAGSGLVYSTLLGGTGVDETLGIAVDGAGDAYVTGVAQSTDFPVTPGAFQTVNHSAATAFVTKLNPTGSALVYSTYLGGSGRGAYGGDIAKGIAVDSAGDAYVAGTATSADFPVTPGAYQTTNPVGDAGFVTKLNATGTALVYSTFLGAPQYGAGANGVAVDTSGNAYVVGSVSGPGFPTTNGAFEMDGFSSFVTKLNATGSGLIYSTYLDGTDSGGTRVSGIGVDASGNAYLTGYTNSSQFPVTANAYQTTNHEPNTTAPYLAELNPAGTQLLYSTYLGGSGVTIEFPVGIGYLGDVACGIALDGKGDAYVAGMASSIDFPVTAGAYQTTNNAAIKTPSVLGFTASNGFVAKFQVGVTAPPNAANPKFSLSTGTYPSAQFVTISDATVGATIYYTTDGTPPTTSSMKYTGEITVAATETLEAIAVATGYTDSAVSTAVYTIAASGPTVSGLTLSAAGPYTLNQFVTATVTCTEGSSVVVLCGDKTYASGVLTTGPITVTVPTANPGLQTLAVMATDAAGKSSSNSVQYQVLPADDQISFNLSPVPVTYPASVTASVQVANLHGHVPTGQVQIFDENGDIVAAVNLSGGAASATLTGIPVGNYYYHAVYLGDSYNAGGVSAQRRATVLREAVTLSVTCTASPIRSGSSFTCSAPATAATGTTVGYETYSLDGGSTVSVALRSGTGTFTITHPAVGPHSVVVDFPQQTDYVGSGPITVNFTVNP